MNYRRQRAQPDESHALTVIEVIAVVAAIGVLVAVLAAWMTDACVKADGIRCISFNKQIGVAFRLFASDHRDGYPMEVSTRSPK